MIKPWLLLQIFLPPSFVYRGNCSSAALHFSLLSPRTDCLCISPELYSEQASIHLTLFAIKDNATLANLLYRTNLEREQMQQRESLFCSLSVVQDNISEKRRGISSAKHAAPVKSFCWLCCIWLLMGNSIFRARCSGTTYRSKVSIFAYGSIWLIIDLFVYVSHRCVCSSWSAPLSSNRLPWAHCLRGENNANAFVTHFASNRTQFLCLLFSSPKESIKLRGRSWKWMLCRRNKCNTIVIMIHGRHFGLGL